MIIMVPPNFLSWSFSPENEVCIREKEVCLRQQLIHTQPSASITVNLAV